MSLWKIARTIRTQSMRRFQASATQLHKPFEKPTAGEKLTVTFITTDNERITLDVKPGANLLDIAHGNDIELEGACEGSLACSTCHVIVEDQAFFDKIEEPTDEENDMLDLAFGLTET